MQSLLLKGEAAININNNREDTHIGQGLTTLSSVTLTDSEWKEARLKARELEADIIDKKGYRNWRIEFGKKVASRILNDNLNDKKSSVPPTSTGEENTIDIHDAEIAVKEKVVATKFDAVRKLPQAEFTKVLSKMSTDELVEMQSLKMSDAHKEILSTTLSDRLSVGEYIDLSSEKEIDDFADVFGIGKEEVEDILLTLPGENETEIATETPGIPTETDISQQETVPTDQTVVPEEIVAENALESLKVPELRKLAKQANIKGYGKMKKAELISAIQNIEGKDTTQQEPYEEVPESSSNDDLFLVW